MVRPRDFDEATVLQRLSEVFAVHGYAGTSISLLTQATGLGRQSLYNSFGDKHALYARAVETAVARMAPVVAAVRAAPTGGAGVQIFFDDLLGRCSDPGADRHCIVSKGLLERLDDALLVAQLQQRWAGTRELLRAAVERGQRDGSITSPEPSGVLADLLMSLMAGLRVMVQTNPESSHLVAVMKVGLAVLNPSLDSSRSNI